MVWQTEGNRVVLLYNNNKNYLSSQSRSTFLHKIAQQKYLVTAWDNFSSWEQKIIEWKKKKNIPTERESLTHSLCID